jgi:hypothetical protein
LVAPGIDSLGRFGYMSKRKRRDDQRRS